MLLGQLLVLDDGVAEIPCSSSSFVSMRSRCSTRAKQRLQRLGERHGIAVAEQVSPIDLQGGNGPDPYADRD